MTEPMVRWEETYCIGAAQIDEQHRSLVELINKFNLELNSTDVSNYDSFRRAAKATVKYVQEHFASEEELMRSHGYPELAEQKKRHAELIRRLLEDTSRFDQGDRLAPTSFLAYLADWLLHHIAVEDAKIGVFVATRGGEEP